MNNDMPHMRVVYGLLRLGFPRFMGTRVVGENPDNIKLICVAEFNTIEARQLAAKNDMETLRRNI